MRLHFLFLTVVLVLSGQSSAQTETDRGKQVIDAAIQALGGDRFLQLRSRVASGRVYSFFHDRMSGLSLAKIYVHYEGNDTAQSLGVVEREYLGKKLDYSDLYLADQAWEITYRGPRRIPDEDWQKYFRSTRNDVLYILRCRLHEPGLQFEYIGSDVYLSTHVEIVDITDATNQSVRVYFDHNTHLPIHQTFAWLDAQTRQHNDEAAEYGKWRDTGGVQWPYAIERERNGYKVFQIFADNVVVDQDVPTITFQVPTGKKVQPPPK